MEFSSSDNSELKIGDDVQWRDDAKMTVGYLQELGKTNADYSYWWPHPVYVDQRDNRHRQAYKAVTVLLEKGYLKGITARKFVELVDELAREL